jgi:hypothetical protein
VQSFEAAAVVAAAEHNWKKVAVSVAAAGTMQTEELDSWNGLKKPELSEFLVFAIPIY